MNKLVTRAPAGLGYELMSTNQGDLPVELVPDTPTPGGSLSGGQWFRNRSVLDPPTQLLTNTITSYVTSPDADFAIALDDTRFTLTPAGCLLTYVGTETKRFLISLDASITTVFAPSAACLGISVNGDLVDSATPLIYANEHDVFINQNAGYSVHRVAELATGDTVQPVFGNALASSDLFLFALQLAVFG